MTAEKKLVRSKSGLRIVAASDSHRSPFELCEPPWVADRECSSCTQCKEKFDFLNRRHHCRRCGHIYCNTCCCTKMALPRMCFIDPVRICNECTEPTRKENDFFDKHLKTLMHGANFVLSSMSSMQVQDATENLLYFCKLSSDHRFIVFDGTSARNPIDVNGIQSTHLLKPDSSIEANDVANEVTLVYIDATKLRQKICFTAAAMPDKKPAVAWIIALHKAVKLKNESQSAAAT